MTKLRRKMSRDRGDSLVSALLVLPIMFALLITMIDASVYLANRAQLGNLARDGARTVAIMGGNGGTVIEKTYGDTLVGACDPVRQINAKLIAQKADPYPLTDQSTVTECHIMQSLANSKGLVNVKVTSVSCTPAKATSVGDPVSCTIKWSYGGIPASVLSMVKMGENVVTTGSSSSEVGLS